MPPIGDTRDVRSLIQEHLDSHKVVIFSKSYCSYCNKVKALFDSLTVGYYALELDVIEKGAEIQATLADMTGQKTVPSVFIGGQHVGGCDSTLKLHAQERLLPMVRGEIDETTYDYDLIVIGGGSGGLAAAKEAAKLGQKVACLDFVQPSPRGTTWGLGGTCVNVGCIPKKLMHQTTLLRRALDDAREFGWEFSDQVSHSWDRMTQAIQDHIGSLNFNYKVQLRSASVTYINAYAEFIAPHKIKCTDRSGVEKVLTSKFFVIATGGRPRYPNVPGAKEFGISSDDLFSLPYCPGRTVSVGASYVSLECAGFLRGLGLDVTVMVRSILLRGFDQQMAELAGDFMKAEGVKFLRPCVPTKVTVCCSFTLSYYISSLHPPINRLFSVSFVNWLCDLGVLLDCATSLWLVYLDRAQSVVNTTARLTASSHKCDHVTLLLHRLPVPECIIYKLCFSSRCGGFHADCLSWCCPTSTCAVACGQHPLPMLSVKHPRWTC